MSLERAFASFEYAADRLTRVQSDLRARVERLEGDLLAANQELEAVIDAVEDGIAVVAPGGTPLRANRAFVDRGLLAGGEIDPVLAPLARSGGAARVRHRDPAGRELELAVSCVRAGGDGNAVFTVRDVTDIRREEEEGGRRRRLEALGRMAAELAHEVRNPLGGIRLFAGLLRDDLELDERSREMVDLILSAVAGLESTVSNLLSFAAPSVLRPRPVDLAGIAREACALLAPACAARGVRLDAPDAGATVRVHGDPEGLRQIVLNLLGNATNATESGGGVRVSVDAAGAAGTTAVLEVADDGHGIAAEDLTRVFDPFFSRTEGGSGLGLSIVQRIVEAHGGRIALESAPGRGTVARVELPAGGETPDE